MIELKHVTFGYNKKQMVLQDINITIPDGENVGILGESGCGKVRSLHWFLACLNLLKEKFT